MFKRAASPSQSRLDLPPATASPPHPPPPRLAMPTIDLTHSSQASSPSATPPANKRQKTSTITPASRPRPPRQQQIKGFLTTPGQTNNKKPSAGGAKSTGKAGGSAKGSASKGNKSILSFFKPVSTPGRGNGKGAKSDALFIAHGGYGLDVSDPEDDDEMEMMWIEDEDSGVRGKEEEKGKDSVARNLRGELEMGKGVEGEEGGDKMKEVLEISGNTDEGSDPASSMPPPPTPVPGPKPAGLPFGGLKLNLGKSMLFGGAEAMMVKKNLKASEGSQAMVMETQFEAPEKMDEEEEEEEEEEDRPLEDKVRKMEHGLSSPADKMSQLSMEQQQHSDPESSSPYFKKPSKPLSKKYTKIKIPSPPPATNDEITSTFLSHPSNILVPGTIDEVSDFSPTARPRKFDDSDSGDDPDTGDFDPAARAIEKGFSQLNSGNNWKSDPDDGYIDDDVDDDDDIEFTQDTAEKGGNDTSAYCPICQSSLEALSEAERNRHVNRCLDGEDPEPPPLKLQSTIPKTPTSAQKKEGGWFTRLPNPHNTSVPSTMVPSTVLPDTQTPISTSAFTTLMRSTTEATAWRTAANRETANRDLRASDRSCPFYKILFPSTSSTITVDAFRYGSVPSCNAYFLSHFHSDHYGGLSKSWSHGPIYCSPITAALVKHKLHVPAQYVFSFHHETWFTPPETPTLRVYGIDANHCPGAMIFLFERHPQSKWVEEPQKTQRFLHCGDFRASEKHILHPLLTSSRIDALYLDTTYLDPKYSFPSQISVCSAAAEYISDLNTRLLSSSAITAKRALGFLSSFARTQPVADSPPPRLLVLIGTYSIGKEHFFLALADALKTLIFCLPPKATLLRHLEPELPGISALLTDDPAKAQVHLQPLQAITVKTLREYLETMKPRGFTHIVGFKPSGWSWQRKVGASKKNVTSAKEVKIDDVLYSSDWNPVFKVDDMPAQQMRGTKGEEVKNGETVVRGFEVPYSEHSSFAEMTRFVCAIGNREGEGRGLGKVLPTVGVGSEKKRGEMRGWVEKWEIWRRGGRYVPRDEGKGEGEGEGEGKDKGKDE